MRVRGGVARVRLVAVLLAGVLGAGVLVAVTSGSSPGGGGRGPSEPVTSGADELPPADPAENLAAEPAEHDPAGGEPAEPAARPEGEVEPPPPTPPDRPAVVIGYRVEVRASGAAITDFPAVVHDVLSDPRGWARAGFRFVRDPEAAYTIVVAEGDDVDRLCHPYDTGGEYSCQNGPVVALNADRWRSATPEWPGSLAGYRTMLVNHEVGHLLHLHHPEPQCPGPGLPAPVMAQQSGGPAPCLPHSWPLQWEIDLAAQRREPLAPHSGHEVSDHRPTPPPARS